ncbi:nuclear transport factor 2 family protein [Nonomuraea sp. NPDC050786]|uniref:nuclear transport factor 2 family protein n=1 Tax=Nonomuraea sp. NPDC050786 TaxID=3154840 RepID=UPI0033EE2AD4
MSENVRAVIEHLRQALAHRNADAFTAVFADDAVYELRFGMPGQPRRFEGAQVIREHMKRGASDGIAQALRFDDVRATVYETTDPEVAVVEFEPAGSVRDGGAPFRFASSLGVIRVRDGAVLSYLDYPNPVGAAEAVGLLPELAAMLAAAQPTPGTLTPQEVAARLTPGAATAKEVAARLIEASVANDHAALVALYAPDVVIEIPFAPPGVPTRSTGSDHLRDRLEAAAGLRRFERAEAINLLETADPDVVVAEFTLHGSITATGRPFSSTYVMIITVRDGLIAHSRDYGNPLSALSSPA